MNMFNTTREFKGGINCHFTYTEDLSEAAEGVGAELEVHKQGYGWPVCQPCLLQAPAPHMPKPRNAEPYDYLSCFKLKFNKYYLLQLGRRYSKPIMIRLKSMYKPIQPKEYNINNNNRMQNLHVTIWLLYWIITICFTK